MLNPSDYSLQFVTEGGITGIVGETNLQWGYRIYNEAYPLEATAPTC